QHRRQRDLRNRVEGADERVEEIEKAPVRPQYEPEDHRETRAEDKADTRFDERVADMDPDESGRQPIPEDGEHDRRGADEEWRNQPARRKLPQGEDRQDEKALRDEDHAAPLAERDGGLPQRRSREGGVAQT